MARFVAAYSQPDGEAPRWGDADDARALRFASGSVSDHRYLIGIVSELFADPELRDLASGSLVEAVWILGTEAASRIPQERAVPPRSNAFRDGGVFVMANDEDHVFIDCGPVGLAGRGGHGHNDCLSFEVVLRNERIVVDPGCYVYTASYDERNLFRSTAYHNTPCVDDEELNRFMHPDYLWNLHYDAIPDVREWRSASDHDVLRCAHRGFEKLISPVVPERTFVLHHRLHALAIHDRFEGAGDHLVRIPLHLAPGVIIADVSDDSALLQVSRGTTIRLQWSRSGYQFNVGVGRWARSYGVAVPVVRLEWMRTGSLAPLSICIAEAEQVASTEAHELLSPGLVN